MTQEQEEVIAAQIASLLRFLLVRLPQAGAVLPPEIERMNDEEIDQFARELAPRILRNISITAGSPEQTQAVLQNLLAGNSSLITEWLDASISAGESPASESAINRDGALLFYRKAMQKLQLENYAAAVPLLQRSVELMPDFAKSWDALAVAYKALGRPEKSFQAHLRAVELKRQL